MIRLCKFDDEQQWLKLNKEFIEYEYKDENVWENPLDRGDIGEIFREILDHPEYPNRLFLVVESDQVIGFVNTTWFSSVWAHGKVLFIDDFFITEEFRGKGYGKTAIKELESLVKSQGFVRLQLMAEDTNPDAGRFYEREGYSKEVLNFFCKYI
ncbi:MAG: GNAT family N-acetyltransferase [Anaerovoracaceae bacterium]